MAGLTPPAVVKSVSTPKSALPSAMNQTAMNMTISRPAISTNAIAMLMTTDSVMPMKFTTDSSDDEHAGSPAGPGGADQSSAKYCENPVASDPAAAKLADRKDTVIRNVSALLPKALLT